ncbi:PLP-dependent transferase [Parathielavia appendiculata]|uniref:PLP-dependent transferase n=1 Tax=Parathielavia appendiculata TaxID=2587402 RepID=A0AAN6U8Q0_9PEZI|nr:PLP-dependent transferase [Parathielavia appendiculata]
MLRIPIPAPTGSLLWRSLRVYQIYGANTDVGKTIFTTLLCITARRHWRNEETVFLKPVSTGAAEDADDRHIQRFAPGTVAKTLFQYDLAVSPHLAARRSNHAIPSDGALLAEISGFAARHASRGGGWLFVETAGGVHSPSPSGSTQADLYMPLRLPIVLVGDSKLGGISQTISAFESLRMRGYDVETVLLFRETQYQNHVYLAEYFGERHGIPVRTVPAPPKRADDPRADALLMDGYYSSQESGSCAEGGELHSTLMHLDARHQSRLTRLDSMAIAASQKIWYPFTQQRHLTPSQILVINSARGDYFQTLVSSTPSGPAPATGTGTVPFPSKASPVLQPSFDASASWWTQGLGHANPSLTLAASYAAGRYGHVMFAEAVHEPALALAETLLDGMASTSFRSGVGGGSSTKKHSPPRLSRVFFSDNGSTGVEVAVKMALRAARVRYGYGYGREKVGEEEEGLGVLGLQGSYHGDTIGAMDCSAPGVFNEKVEWYRGRGFWFGHPVVECRGGKWMVSGFPEGMMREDGCGEVEYPSLSDVFDVEAREARGEGRVYEKFIRRTLEELTGQGRRFGALMIEPVVLGAGGMLMVDPLFQRTLVNVVRQSSALFSRNGTTYPSADDDGTTWTGLPVIFDEVFTGLYRLGRFSAASFLGVDADISVHAKLLTGGLVPLSVTLASESIFRAFESDDKSDALLHGHSYTAHPVGCQVALESIREMQRMEARGDWDWARDASGAQTLEVLSASDLVWSVWSPEFVLWVSQLPASFVGGVWALGSVLTIRLTSVDGNQGYKGSAARAVRDALLQGRSGVGEARWNVHSRVLGNTLYLMAGQKTTQESVRLVQDLLRDALLKAQNAQQH